MSDPTSLIDKAVALIGQHLEQLKIDSNAPTKDGSLKGLTQYDSQVIERYTKLLIALNKKGDSSSNEFEGLSDEELEAKLNGTNNDNEDIPTEGSDD